MENSISNKLYALGVGIFGFLAINEFSGLVEYLLEQFIFILRPGSILTLWMPELLGLIVFVYLILWMIRKIKNHLVIESKKLLVNSIFIFFGLVLFRFLYSYTVTGYLYSSFPNEFDAFHVLREEQRQLQSFMSFVPTFKYVVLAVLLLKYSNSTKN